MRPAVDDLGLSRREPSRSAKPAADVTRATSMHEVPLTAAPDDEGGPDDEFEFDPKSVGDPFDEFD